LVFLITMFNLILSFLLSKRATSGFLGKYLRGAEKKILLSMGYATFALVLMTLLSAIGNSTEAHSSAQFGGHYASASLSAGAGGGLIAALVFSLLLLLYAPLIQWENPSDPKPLAPQQKVMLWWALITFSAPIAVGFAIGLAGLGDKIHIPEMVLTLSWLACWLTALTLQLIAILKKWENKTQMSRMKNNRRQIRRF